jgi:hypothetical protein
VIEFIEECRREWNRLGVPDPIANEMAADLTADIEEAEAEGGSAEDVLGDSVFDPRRFAAAWAGARGVTAPPPPVPVVPSAVPGRERPRWYRQALALALAVVAFLTVLVAAGLLVGRRSAAVAASVSRISGVPGSSRLIGPGPTSPPFRIAVPGPAFVIHQSEPVAILAFALLVAAIGGLGLAVLVWSPWFRRDPN